VASRFEGLNAFLYAFGFAEHEKLPPKHPKGNVGSEMPQMMMSERPSMADNNGLVGDAASIIGGQSAVQDVLEREV